jgi:hypothetical protein
LLLGVFDFLTAAALLSKADYRIAGLKCDRLDSEGKRTDAASGAVPQPDAMDRQHPLRRHPVVLQLLPPGESRREQLGGRSEGFVEQPPEHGWIVDGESVGIFSR